METERNFEALSAQLKRWNGRRRLRDGLLWVPRGMLTGLLLALFLATLARFYPLLTNGEIALIAVLLAGAGALVSLLILALRRYPLMAQARFADRQFTLQERASTAVEIHSGAIQTTPILAQQQLRDTLAATAQVDTERALPLEFRLQEWLLLLLAVILLATAVFLDNPQAAILASQRAISQEVAQQAAALDTLAADIRQNPALDETQQAQLLAPIESARDELQAGNLSQEEAVAVLSEAEAELRTLSNELANESLRQTLQQAGQPLAEQAPSQALGQALQNGDLLGAAQQAGQLADELGNLSAAQREQLAQDLAQTAAALQNADSQLAQQLNQAAQALQNGDTEAAQEALRQAAGTLQQRGQETAVARQAQNAADQLSDGRRAIAQAGQDGQQTAAEQQAGTQGGQQGEQPGPGSGNAQGEGQGAGSQGGGPEGEAGTAGNAGEPGPGGGHVENVFVPDFVDLSGAGGVNIELPAACQGDAATCGDLLQEKPAEFGVEGSIVPYAQVFGDYRNAASEALADEHIPLGLKTYVRDYFSSLEP